MMSSSRPRCARSPSTGRPIFPASSDTKKIASPGFAPVAAVSSARLSSDRNFAIGPFACSASTRYATPARPSAFPASSVLSKKLRDFSAAPGATIARTTLPAATAFANTAKPDSRKISVTSTARIGLRRSGLSLP